MAYDAKAQKKYRKKSLQLSCMYRPTDIAEGLRIKKYLADTGQSANSYIKGLIKRDLDSKGIEYVGHRDGDGDIGKDVDKE